MSEEQTAANERTGIIGWIDNQIPVLGAIDDFCVGKKTQAPATEKAENPAIKKTEDAAVENNSSNKNNPPQPSLAPDAPAATSNKQSTYAAAGTIVAATMLGSPFDRLMTKIPLIGPYLGFFDKIADAKDSIGAEAGSLAHDLKQKVFNGKVALTEKKCNGVNYIFAIKVNDDGKPVVGSEPVFVTKGKTLATVFANHKNYDESMNITNLPLMTMVNDVYNTYKNGSIGDAIHQTLDLAGSFATSNIGKIVIGAGMVCFGASFTTMLGKAASLVPEWGMVLGPAVKIIGSTAKFGGGLGLIAWGAVGTFNDVKGLLGGGGPSDKDLQSLIKQSDLEKAGAQIQTPKVAVQSPVPEADLASVTTSVNKPMTTVDKAMFSATNNFRSTDSAVETAQSKAYSATISPASLASFDKVLLKNKEAITERAV